MAELIQMLHTAGHLEANTADRAKLQYTEMCDLAEGELKQQFKGFDYSSRRLAEFYSTMIGDKEDFGDLYDVIKIVLNLSHGQAQVESGFSINKDVTVENMHEDSVVAQRQVYDAVYHLGGYLKVDIDSAMMSHFRTAYSSYEEAQKKKKSTQTAEEKRKVEKTSFNPKNQSIGDKEGKDN